MFKTHIYYFYLQKIVVMAARIGLAVGLGIISLALELAKRKTPKTPKIKKWTRQHTIDLGGGDSEGSGDDGVKKIIDIEVTEKTTTQIFSEDTVEYDEKTLNTMFLFHGENLGNTEQEATNYAYSKGMLFERETKFGKAKEWYRVAYKISKRQHYLDKVKDCEAEIIHENACETFLTKDFSHAQALFKEAADTFKSNIIRKTECLKRMNEMINLQQADILEESGNNLLRDAKEAMKTGNEIAIEYCIRAKDIFIEAYELRKFDIGTSFTEIVTVLIAFEAIDEIQMIMKEAKRIIPDKMDPLKKLISDSSSDDNNLQAYFDEVSNNSLMQINNNGSD